VIYRIAIVFALLGLYSLLGLQTRIGYPWHYYQHGGLFGFILIVGVSVWAFAELIGLLSIENNAGDSICRLAIALAIVAVLLLCLPMTDSGIQLFPELPWKFSGWIATGISLLVWFLIGGAISDLYTVGKEGPNAFASLLIAAFAINGTLSWCETTTRPLDDTSVHEVAVATPVTPTIPIQESLETKSPEEFQRFIDEWQGKSKLLHAQREALQKDGESLTREMEALLSQEPSQVGEAKATLLAERAELNSQIDRITEEIALIDEVVLRAKSSLRRLVRKNAIEEVTQDLDFESLTRTQRELEELVRNESR
jgi:hypothetical protein